MTENRSFFKLFDHSVNGWETNPLIMIGFGSTETKQFRNKGGSNESYSQMTCPTPFQISDAFGQGRVRVPKNLKIMGEMPTILVFW